MMGKERIDYLSFIRDGKELGGWQKAKLVGKLSLPTIMAQLTSIIMQYIDASMVGHMGANASASIGLVSSTTWLFASLCSAATAGFYIQVAHQIGAKKYEEARGVMRSSFPVVLAVTLVMMTVGILISGRLPGWLGGTQDIRNDASWYFMIYICFLPAAACNRLAGGMLQCSGNMKTPGLLNSLMCLLDVMFNGLFIFPTSTHQIGSVALTLPGLGLGVKGAALGTGVAELVIACIMLYSLCIRSKLLHLRKEKVVCDTKAVLRSAATLSLPIALENLITCSAYVMFTKIVAPLGAISIAAHSFAVTAESLCYMPGYGIGEAATTLVGQSVGAKRRDMTRSFARMTTAFGVAIMTGMGVFMYFAAPFMMGLLTPEQSVCTLGTGVLRIEAFAEPLYGASIVASGALRGAGDTLMTSVLNFGSIWLVRLPLGFFLARQYGLTGVWIAMCIELCVRGTLFLIRLFREGWMKKL